LRQDQAKKKGDKPSARDTYQTECIVARKRRKIETPLSRPAPPRSVLVADMFQQRFSRVDRTTALYRAFATTVFLMIFLRDFTDGALRRRRCNRGDDDKHASNTYKKRLPLALLALGQLSVELSRAKARGFIAPPSGCKKFLSFAETIFRSPFAPASRSHSKFLAETKDTKRGTLAY